MTSSSPNITALLRRLSDGDPEVLDDLLPLVYGELHRQAQRYLRRERPGHTLQPTALINEAYLKLVDQKNVKWESRSHFFAIAAKLMRRILVDHARMRHRDKRGGEAENVPLDDVQEFIAVEQRNVDLIALDEALDRLAKKDEQQARIVELRYFSGLGLDETADVLGISRATVARDWAVAKAWLFRELSGR